MTAIFKKIVVSEIVYQVRKPLFIVFAAIVFILSFHDITITSPTASGLISIGPLNHNATLVISKLVGIISALIIIAAPFIIAQAVQRDFDHNLHSIMYSYPISDSEYLLGRFLGAFLSFSILPFIAIIGAWIGGMTLADSYTGYFHIGLYLCPFILIVLPGLLFGSAVIFWVTLKTRKNSTIYLTAITVFVFLFLIQAFLGDQIRYVSQSTIGTIKWLTLLDPFGASVLSLETTGMTVAEKNDFTLFSSSFLVIHRLFWTVISIGLLVTIKRTFLRTYSLDRKRMNRKSSNEVSVYSPVRELAQLPQVTVTYNLSSKLSSLFRLSWFDFKYSVFNIGFVLIILLSLSSLHSNFIKNVDSTGIFPTTSYFINTGMDNVDMPILLLVLFFTGVIIWREKDHNFDRILYSYPIKNTFILGQKWISLSLIILFYFFIIFSFGVLSQTLIYGFSDLNLKAYGSYLAGYKVFNYLVIATGFSLIHILSPNKFIGYALSVVGILFVLFAPSLGIVTHLLRPGTLPEAPYSELNQFNPVSTINGWLRLYWGLFVAFALAWAIIMIDRGGNTSWRKRLSESRVNMRLILGVLGISVLSGFGYISVKSTLFTPAITDIQTYLEYEKLYKQYEGRAQPAITDIKLNVDLYPSDNSGSIEGIYGVKNTSETLIEEIHITLINTEATTLKQLFINREGMFFIKDFETGYAVYSFEEALQPGDSTTFSYSLVFNENKYKDHNFNLNLADNGLILDSFAGNIKYFPQIGYKRELEVQNETLRAEKGIDKKPSTLIKYSDNRPPSQMARDIINYEAVISTEIDHTAISSGYLVEMWSKENRNNYHYKTQSPISGEFGIVSGEYQKHTEATNGLTINIFFDPKHDYNLQSITEGIKDSYRFNTSYFGEYSFYPEINIVEVPGYGVINGTALSKPSLILWNENGGFTADIQHMYIDRVYSTAVHEMAHQWWGHQLRPISFTEGQQLMYETIAQYVRLTALKEKYDSSVVNRFLEEEKFYYKTGVSLSSKKEPPLFKASDSHIIYNKGTLVMDSLRVLLGEQKLNDILRRFYSEYALNNKNPVSGDFVRIFKEQAPDSVTGVVINLLTEPGFE